MDVRQVARGVPGASITWHQSRRQQEAIAFVVRFAYLILVGAVLLLPFAWMVSTSLKPSSQVFAFPPEWIPSPFTWSNYPRALTWLPFHLFLRNTVVISAMATLGTLVTASMAAYAFARLTFRGRDLWFSVVISTMMLPHMVTLIPQFIVYTKLEWVNTFLPLIVPWWLGGGPFNIFLFRQFFRTIPIELEEAARIDGAGSFRIYAQIMLPLSKPVLATVGVLGFLHHWDDFLGPLIYLNSMHLKTLAIGLRAFQSQYGTEWELLMAASTAVILPVLVIFFVAQRYIVRGIHLSGLAGR